MPPPPPRQVTVRWCLPQGLGQPSGTKLWPNGCAGAWVWGKKGEWTACAQAASLTSRRPKAQGSNSVFRCGPLGSQSQDCRGSRLQQPKQAFEVHPWGQVFLWAATSSSKQLRSHPRRPQLPVPPAFPRRNSLRQLLSLSGNVNWFSHYGKQYKVSSKN